MPCLCVIFGNMVVTVGSRKTAATVDWGQKNKGLPCHWQHTSWSECDSGDHYKYEG